MQKATGADHHIAFCIGRSFILFSIKLMAMPDCLRY